MSPEPRAANGDPFDALADLFLGELGRVAAHDVALGFVPAPMQPPYRPARAAAAPAAGAGQTDEPPTAATPPTAQATAVSQAPRLTLVSPPSTLDDDAADDTGEDASDEALAGPMIEALVLGHLPVLASAWAARYVRHAAEQEGHPVGLIRLAGGQVRAELIPPPGERVSAGGQALSGVQDLHEAWRVLLHNCQRIVIHADHDHEPALIASPMVDEVTLLSAADEAAVVNAYRTLKTIASRTQGEIAGSGASLRVAVMGAPEPRAKYVWSRLEEAAESFLGRPLRCAGLISQIGGGSPGRVLFVGPCDGTAAEVVGRLTTIPARNEARPAVTAPAKPAPILHDEAEDDEQAWAPQVAEPPASRRVHERSRAVAAEPACASHRPESLARLLEGLTPIKARCPKAPEVELALDAQGGLHALAVIDDAAAQPGTERHALVSLTVAAAWAQQHREVLQLTLGADSPEIAQAPARQHLFTPRPADVRGLLESDVRVHLLATVPPRATAGWLTTALN
jgi:hypothetical protein